MPSIAQQVEVILARQLSSYMAMPVFIASPNGDLVYYNESAEFILGCRFEETGELPIAEWSTIFRPTDEQGMPLSTDMLPLAVALRERRPNFRTFWIVGLDGVRHHLEVSAFPLLGQSKRFLGAIAVFWEVTPS